MSKRTVTGFGLGSLILLITFFVMEKPTTGYWRGGGVHSVIAKDLREESQGPRNSTLGFQKIFYISLPE